MKHNEAKIFEVDLESHAETGRVGAACSAIEAAGGVVHTGDVVLKKIVYTSTRSLQAEIAAVLCGKPGDRVS